MIVDLSDHKKNVALTLTLTSHYESKQKVFFSIYRNAKMQSFLLYIRELNCFACFHPISVSILRSIKSELFFSHLQHKGKNFVASG